MVLRTNRYGLDGWDRRSLAPRPDAAPRPVDVLLARAPRMVRLHRFADDGSVTVRALPPEARIPVQVTDRLAVLEVV